MTNGNFWLNNKEEASRKKRQAEKGAERIKREQSVKKLKTNTKGKLRKGQS